jgi:hypothetical protein
MTPMIEKCSGYHRYGQSCCHVASAATPFTTYMHQY